MEWRAIHVIRNSTKDAFMFVHPCHRPDTKQTNQQQQFRRHYRRKGSKRKIEICFKERIVEEKKLRKKIFVHYFMNRMMIYKFEYCSAKNHFFQDIDQLIRNH